MNAQTNAINWFEIPVTDMPRAKHFYQTVCSIHMEESNMMSMEMAMFPYDPGSGKLSGTLVKSPYHTPSQEGTMVYLNVHPDLSEALGKVEEAGGKIVMPKTKISDENGYMAMFLDTEGNRVALHSQH